MDGLMNFLADNYVYFMIGAGVLLLALIGFIVDGRRKKKKEEMNENMNAQSTIQQAPESVQAQVQEEQISQSVNADNLAEQQTPSVESTQEPSLSNIAQAPENPESIFSIPEANTNQTIGEPIVVQSPNSSPEKTSVETVSSSETEDNTQSKISDLVQKPETPVTEEPKAVEVQAPAIEIPTANNNSEQK